MKVEMTYVVIVLQATGEPLSIMESSVYADCKASYDKIVMDLEKARKTKTLFKLSEPWIFACDPQFIVRVTLVPKKVPKVADDGNPYQRRMIEKGFANTMKNPVSDLTDEGYAE